MLKLRNRWWSQIECQVFLEIALKIFLTLLPVGITSKSNLERPNCETMSQEVSCICIFERKDYLFNSCVYAQKKFMIFFMHCASRPKKSLPFPKKGRFRVPNQKNNFWKREILWDFGCKTQKGWLLATIPAIKHAKSPFLCYKNSDETPLYFWSGCFNWFCRLELK